MRGLQPAQETQRPLARSRPNAIQRSVAHPEPSDGSQQGYPTEQPCEVDVLAQPQLQAPGVRAGHVVARQPQGEEVMNETYKDYTHCPGNGPYFSPVAPPDYCAGMPINSVPEPSTALLLLVALVAFALVRRLRR